jgi:hypothetical protein
MIWFDVWVIFTGGIVKAFGLQCTGWMLLPGFKLMTYINVL